MNQLEQRILDISKKHGLSHLGSCLTALPLIREIYDLKKTDEKFVLSCGHAAMALYCVNEIYHGIDAEKAFLHHGVHPDKCDECKLDCSTGSLGLGLSIALGMAMADRSKNVYCLISDGESFEGVTWEVANVIDKYKVDNLKIYCNFNGFGAYDKIELLHIKKLKAIFPSINVVQTNFDKFTFLKGQQAHYYIQP